VKRFLVLISVVVLLCGCAAQRAVPQSAEKDIDPTQTAAQVWLKLTDLPQPEPLALDKAARLLQLGQTDLARGVVLLDPANSCREQLFLLCAAPKKGEKLQSALQNRLELVGQTSAAMLGEKETDQPIGCVVQAGQWYALLVPSDMDEERTQQARQTLLEAFD
jgi:hypothetical protein